VKEIDCIPRLSFGLLPTPVERFGQLSEELGVSLSVKCDHFTGFAGGGNKLRKLEYLMADAVARKATILITAGGQQSNHARITAAAARKFGMTSLLVLRGARPNSYQGNLLLDQLFDAEIDYFDTDHFTADIVGARMQSHADRIRAAGGSPYVIPVGGATPLGTIGYVSGIQEMARQYQTADRAPPDYIVVAAGTGGTMAGLLIGCSLYWPDTRVIGVKVTVTDAPYGERVVLAANLAAEFLELDKRWSADDIWIEHDYVGPGYGVPSEAGNAAIRTVARSEGMLLDPIYTGKAFSGLLGCIAAGRIKSGSSVLFIHTGGEPALFSFAESLSYDRVPRPAG
jgi:D-cysteine desulfhydrase